MFVMYYIYGSVRAIPTYRVYQLYDTILLARCYVVAKVYKVLYIM